MKIDCKFIGQFESQTLAVIKISFFGGWLKINLMVQVLYSITEKA
jgi:hypothetical protein